MTKSLISTLIAAMMALVSFAANAQAYGNADTRQKVFNKNIRTIKVAPRSNEYLPPIVTIGSDDVIKISFDELAEDRRYLQYSVTHCNADWQPSNLNEAEYLDGFNLGDIEEYQFSSATFTHYVHYAFYLPNDQLRITRSGNYLVKVFPEDDPDNALFQARFYVCQGSANLRASVTSRTDIDYNNHMQQLEVNANFPTAGVVTDPYNDLKLYVRQNMRDDNAVAIFHPSIVNDINVEYTHCRDLIFPASNEFRRIETVSIHSFSMGVEKMRYFEPYYHAELRIDFPRNDQQYLYDETQYGRFTIREADSDESDVQADYLVTHFTLNTAGPLDGGRLYIDGEMTGHVFDSNSLMKYNSSTGCYECALLLKQGAYNYQYLWIPDGQTVGNTAKVEGDYYETINEYFVLLYKRAPTDRADTLVAFAITFSGK